MMEAFLSTVLAIAATAIIVALCVWVVKACDPCKHSYKRIDDCNDKKMVLVCSRCGKIKTLRK